MSGDNVVNVTFNRKEATRQAIVEGIERMDFDKLVLIGTKGGDIYTSYTGIENTLELIGLVEMVKMNIVENA